jgi:hypothetical protein
MEVAANGRDWVDTANDRDLFLGKCGASGRSRAPVGNLGEANGTDRQHSVPRPLVEQGGVWQPGGTQQVNPPSCS